MPISEWLIGSRTTIPIDSGDWTSRIGPTPIPKTELHPARESQSRQPDGEQRLRTRDNLPSTAGRRRLENRVDHDRRAFGFGQNAFSNHELDESDERSVGAACTMLRRGSRRAMRIDDHVMRVVVTGEVREPGL